MKKITFIAIILALFFYGCGTKRQYFEPQQTEKELNSAGGFDSKIVHTSISGATLENGNIITKDGINTTIKIKDGYKFLGENNGLYILSSIDGMVEIIDNSGLTVFSKQFPTAIISASLQANLLASVSSSNDIRLIDIYTAQTLMEYKSSEVFAVDSRVASPIFLTSLIVYPSLDGRIYIVHKNGEIIKDIVISSETFFNNIIFLDVINDNMIAATAKKAMIINPQKTSYFNAEIKDILRKDDKIFIFKKDGNIVKTNFDFDKLADTYFKFAIFSDAAVVDNSLYIVEKTGYIIKTDLDLMNQKIYRLDSEIDSKSFIAKDGLYNNKEFIKFE